MGIRAKGSGRRPGPDKDNTTTLKIKLRGRDNEPLTMRELRESLLDAALALKEYEPNYRAKSVTIYLTMVDEKGQAVRINPANELTLYAYKAAADELGL